VCEPSSDGRDMSGEGLVYVPPRGVAHIVAAASLALSCDASTARRDGRAVDAQYQAGTEHIAAALVVTGGCAWREPNWWTYVVNTPEGAIVALTRQPAAPHRTWVSLSDEDGNMPSGFVDRDASGVFWHDSRDSERPRPGVPTVTSLDDAQREWASLRGQQLRALVDTAEAVCSRTSLSSASEPPVR
jgi:hypothetical protein